MIAKRELAAQLVVRAGLARPLGAVYSATLHRVKVLAYHRVVPRVDEDSFPFDLELVSAWQEEFDWQVRFLAANHEVITCRDLAELLDAGRHVPRAAVIITFDDGYRDNHDVVLPILKQYRVPAVVFVATGYMDASETYWYDQIVNELLRTKATHLPLGGRRAGARYPWRPCRPSECCRSCAGASQDLVRRRSTGDLAPLARPDGG